MPSKAMASTESISQAPAESTQCRFPCESCGAFLEFSVGVQRLECPYCGTLKELSVDPEAAIAEQDFESMLRRLVALRRQTPGSVSGLTEITCTSCGAIVQFTSQQASLECAYCGVPLQLSEAYEAPDRVPVDGVLPFHIDREFARRNLRAWVQSRWFAPNDFVARGVQGRFNGIYLPYWTFDSLTFTRYTGQRGEHYTVTVGSGKNQRTVVKTRWYPAAGSFERFFDDVLTLGSTGLPTKRMLSLEPWPLDGCVPFNRELLAGFLARTYDVELDKAFHEAKGLIDRAIEQEVRYRIGGDTQIVHSIETQHTAITYKHLLLPVWMLAYRYAEKTYQVVVNAGTGEVQGDRPYSWIKITLAAMGGLITAGLVALYFLNQ